MSGDERRSMRVLTTVCEVILQVSAIGINIWVQRLQVLERDRVKLLHVLASVVVTDFYTFDSPFVASASLVSRFVSCGMARRI